MHRRRYLVALSAGTVGWLAGCSAIVEGILDRTLEDVNVVAETEEPVTIRVDIETLDGETAFTGAALFEEDDEGIERYEDVWETSGEYRVRADIEDGLVAIETVELDDSNDSLLVRYGDGDIEIGFPEEFDDLDQPS